MGEKVIGSEYNLKEKLSKAVKGANGVITPTLVASNLEVSQQEAGRLLSRWCKSGWVERIRRGIYIPLSLDVLPHEISLEEPLLIINKLYSPGYLAGYSAIKYWDLSEQLFETVTFFTEKKVKEREIEIAGTKVRLKTISPQKNFGTKTFWENNVKLKVSDPTKTIVDLLDDPQIGGGMRVVFDFFKAYMKSEYCDEAMLVKYLERNGNKTAFKRLGLLLELSDFSKEEYLQEIRSKISKVYSLFDTTMENGRIIKSWNLKVPVSWKIEYDRQK